MSQPTLNTQQLRAPSTDQFEQLSLEQQKFHLQLELSRRAQNDQAVRVESLFEEYPSLQQKPELLLHLITGEISLRLNQGENVEFAELQARFPQHSELLSQFAHFLPAKEEVSSSSDLDSPKENETVLYLKNDLALSSNSTQHDSLTYHIEEELGRGGMGIVYKARHTRLNRPVALKMILYAENTGNEQRMRFEREAQAIARLDHPNIVQIYEIGEHEGKPFISLEFVSGGDLATKLDGKPLSPSGAASLIESLAQGIHEAHKAQVIHRDLKPANVLMTEAGIPKITDFGLAKTLDENSRTISGAIVGTPSYMAPEQAAGITQEMGPWTDIYSLGAILYECLTGQPPFQAATVMETMMQLLDQPPISPSQLQGGIPRDLETICLKCLEKDPAKRYKTAELLAKDLRRFQNGEPIHARPVTQIERFWRWCKRSPMVASLLLLVIIVLLTGTGISVGFALVAGEKAEEATRAKIDAQQRGKELEEEKQHSDQQRELAEIRFYASQLSQAQQQWEIGNGANALTILDNCQWNLRNVEHHYLWTLFHRNQVTLRSHIGRVKCVAFSPDGQRIVSGSTDASLIIWDTITGKKLHALKGHAQSVNSVQFSSDGNRIVSGSSDKTVKVWNARTGQEIHSLEGHRFQVSSVAFSPNGQRIVSGSYDLTIKVWDARAGLELFTFREQVLDINCLAINPNGQHIVSGGFRSFLQVWDTHTRRETHRIKGHKARVRSVAFSPDGLRIVSGSDDKTIMVWDAITHERLLTLEGHTASVSSVAFSPDGSRIVSGCVDGTMKIWDVFTAEELQTLRGNRGAILSVAFSPDGQFIGSGSSDHVVKIWNTNTSQESCSLKGPVNTITDVEFTADGSYIIGGSWDKTITFWETYTGQKVRTLKGHSGGVRNLAISPNGKYIVSGSEDKKLKLWDTQNGQEILTIKGHTGQVTSVAFSPDSRTITSGSLDKTLKLWDTRTGKDRLTLHGHKDSVLSVAFSPDGHHIVSGSSDKTLKVWDAKTGQELRTLRGHTSTIFSIVFSPDGQQVASGSMDETIKLWDIFSGEVLQTLRGHRATVNSVAFSPNGARLVSGSLDKTLKIWEPRTGQEVLSLRGHRGSVRSVAFSPDGKHIISGSEDKTIRVWNAHAEQEKLPVKRHSKVEVTLARFSADGNQIVGQDAQGKKLIWNAITGQRTTDKPAPAKQASPTISPDGKRKLVIENNILKIIPTSPQGPSLQEQFTVMQPNANWHEKEAKRAQVSGNHFAEDFHLSQLLKYHPWRTELHIRRAHLLQKINRPEEAVLHYLTAVLDKPTISLTPIDPTARTRGHAAAKAGKWDEALDAFSLAVHQPNSSANDWYAMLLCQLATENLQGFQRTVSEMLQRFGLNDSLLYYSNLAPCSAKDGEQLIQFASQLKHTPSVLHRIGVFHFHQGHYSESLQAFQKSTELQGKGGYVDTWLFLAMIYHKQKKWEQSQKWMSKVERWAKKATWNSWQDKLRWQIWLKRARQVLSTVPPMPKAD